MLKKIVIKALLLISITNLAMEGGKRQIKLRGGQQLPVKEPRQPLVQPLSFKEYFTKEKLEKETPAHAMCGLILDPSGLDTGTLIQSIIPLTSGAALLILSKSLVDDINFVIQMGTKLRLFLVPDSELAVVITPGFTELYGEKFLSINELEDKSELLNDSEKLKNLETEAKEKAAQKPDTEVASVLKRIFKQYTKKDFATPTMPIWDIYISGHGNQNTIIAGLPIKKIQDVLSFFNTYIATGSVLLNTCFAAGQNSTLLQIQSNFQLNLLNYTLFILGSPDSTSISDMWFKPRLINAFFINAAQLRKQASLQDLLTKIHELNENELSDPRINVPQVWLPGGIGFQDYTIKNHVFSIGPVQEKAHELEKPEFQAFKIPTSAKAVLLYVNEVRVPIYVESSRQPFISMFPGDSLHAFSSIELPKDKGVTNFIAYSLASYQQSKKTFLVDSLQGKNDLFTEGLNAPIELTEVIITGEGDYFAKTNKLSISFRLGNTAWEASASGKLIGIKWENLNPKEYKQKDAQKHSAEYAERKRAAGLQPSLYGRIIAVPEDKQEAWNKLPLPTQDLKAEESQQAPAQFETNIEETGNNITLITPTKPTDNLPLISSILKSVAPFFTKRRDLQAHTFLIKNITGYNDLSVLIEMVNLLHKQNISLPWLKQFIDKPITLESAIITVKESRTDTYRPQITIEGIINGHGIRIASSYITVEGKPRTPSWTIEAADHKTIQDQFNQQRNTLKFKKGSPQKSITEVLKQKQKKIQEAAKQ